MISRTVTRSRKTKGDEKIRSAPKKLGPFPLSSNNSQDKDVIQLTD